MAENSKKGYRLLRQGRVSEAGANYFITFCTAHRAPGLHLEAVASIFIGECHAMQTDDIWIVRCATLMPDHVHLLVKLAGKLSLGKAIARLKARSAPVLRNAGLTWQAGYFDHRLRPKENILPYFIYIYLNPYRAGLIATENKWPWFSCEPADEDWFSSMLNQGLPEPAWLADLP